MLILSKKEFVVIFRLGGVTIVAVGTIPFIDDVAYVSVLLIRSKKAFVVLLFLCDAVAGRLIAIIEDDVSGTTVALFFPFIVDVAYVSILLRRSKKAFVVVLLDAEGIRLFIEVEFLGVRGLGVAFPFIVLVA